MKNLLNLLSKIYERLSYHPVHIILGLVTSTIGICLILDDNYYFWPPGMTNFFNSDCIGTWAFFTGLGLIYVALYEVLPTNANIIWLLSQCGFVGGESFLEFAHGLITHNDHMITFAFAMLGYLLITFWVIRTSGSFDRKATKRIEERDRKLVERRQVTIEKDLVLIITSGALGSILATLIGAYQAYIKRKDQREKRDTDDFYTRWMSAEDEVDRVRDENRALKDEIALLKIKERKNKNG